MATTQKTPFLEQDPSAETTQKRTVEDVIRHLIPASAKLLALVADGEGEVVEKKGMISKKSADSTRVECFTNTPPEFVKTVVSVNSLVLTFAEVTEMYKKQLWTNTKNNSVGIIDSISGNDVTFVSVGAGTAFSAAADDVLMNIGNAYEEFSESPAYLQKADDQVYNLLQTFRFPVAISGSAKTTKHLAGGDYFARMKKYNLIEGKRAIDRALIFGKRASSGNKTTITGASVATTMGLMGYAQHEYDAGGLMTPSLFRKNMILRMDSSVGNDRKLIAFTSREVVARILDWQQDAYRVNTTGVLAKFGIKSHTMVTSGPDIELVAHDAFDGRGGYNNQMLIFDPENVQYRFKNGRDLAPKIGIQNNSADGFMDEIIGEVGILPLDGGASIMKVTNFF